ncbi:hypothetical protein CQA09_28495 [Klebsiella pneumoniae]|nr:hypothetical protein CQA09_28495 [Klebsiella pneumoniae]
MLRIKPLFILCAALLTAIPTASADVYVRNPLNELINGGIRIFRLKRRMRRENKLREGGNNASH